MHCTSLSHKEIFLPIITKKVFSTANLTVKCAHKSICFFRNNNC